MMSNKQIVELEKLDFDKMELSVPKVDVYGGRKRYIDYNNKMLYVKFPSVRAPFGLGTYHKKVNGEIINTSYNVIFDLNPSPHAIKLLKELDDRFSKLFPEKEYRQCLKSKQLSERDSYNSVRACVYRNRHTDEFNCTDLLNPDETVDLSRLTKQSIVKPILKCNGLYVTKNDYGLVWVLDGMEVVNF